MKAKRVAALIAAFIVVASLAIGTVFAESVVLDRGYKPQNIVIDSSTFGYFFATGSEEKPEPVVDEEDEQEETPQDWLEEDGEGFPEGYWQSGFGYNMSWDNTPGYWDTNFDAWQQSMPWSNLPEYWDTNFDAWKDTMPWSGIDNYWDAGYDW